MPIVVGSKAEFTQDQLEMMGYTRADVATYNSFSTIISAYGEMYFFQESGVAKGQYSK